MLKPFPSGDIRRNYQLVADRIRTVIEVDRMRPGARLPAERDLAAQFGVSRQSVREALLALEIDGQVEIRGGSGVYVCAAYKGNPGRPSSGGTPAELMQARIVVERAVITLAATRVNKTGLQRVEHALDAMRADLVCRRDPLQADRLFHLSIAEMSGNVVLAGVIANLFDELHSPGTLNPRGNAESMNAWQIALAEHEAIYQALSASNPVAAGAALYSHLLASRGRWANGPTEALAQQQHALTA